jgi:membrane protease YdiL (CAAX protease family)
VPPAPPYPYPAYPYPQYPYQAYPAAPPQPPVIPKPPEKNAEMKRAFNLTTLSTLVVFGAQSMFVNAALSIVGIVFGLMLVLSGEFNGSFDLSELLHSVMNDVPAMFVVQTLYAVIYAIGMIGGIKLSGTIRKRVEAVLLQKRKLSAGTFIIVVLVCFGVWGVGVLIGNVGMFFSPPESSSFGWASAPTWLIAIIGAPLFEETIFRKFLIDRLHPYGERIAVIFSALIFAMAHQNGMQFFLAFFLGIVFGIVYLRTGNLLYTMFLHFMINTFATADEIGCLIFGDVFDKWWTVVFIALVFAGIGAFVVVLVKKMPFFRLAPNRIEGANRAAFKPWGVILAKVIVCVTIAGYGVFYAAMSYASCKNALALLHLLPAAAAIITILVVSSKTGSKYESAPTPEFAYAGAPYATPRAFPAPDEGFAPQYQYDENTPQNY